MNKMSNYVSLSKRIILPRKFWTLLILSIRHVVSSTFFSFRRFGIRRLSPKPKHPIRELTVLADDCHPHKIRWAVVETDNDTPHLMWGQLLWFSTCGPREARSFWGVVVVTNWRFVVELLKVGTNFGLCVLPQAESGDRWVIMNNWVRSHTLWTVSWGDILLDFRRQLLGVNYWNCYWNSQRSNYPQA